MGGCSRAAGVTTEYHEGGRMYLDSQFRQVSIVDPLYAVT